MYQKKLQAQLRTNMFVPIDPISTSNFLEIYRKTRDSNGTCGDATRRGVMHFVTKSAAAALVPPLYLKNKRRWTKRK